MKLADDLKHVLAHTQPVWQDVAGKTLFLTGGTGFFGKWLLSSFVYANDVLSLDARIIVLSRDPDSFITRHAAYKHPAISFIKGDVRDFEFPEADIDYIIHAATEASVSLNMEQPLLMYDTIVEGTKHVLELARVKKVKAILHTSSGAVYGKQPSSLTHIPEEFNGCPDVYDKGASYGEGKRVAEMLSTIYCNSYGVPSKIARCFAFVGPYLPLDTHFAIGNFIKNVVDGNEIVIKGDGTPYRSYLYASDLAIWLWNILIFGKPCRPYNVGSDRDLTIEQLAELVASCSKNPIKVEVTQPKNNLPPTRYVPDVTRAKEELHLDVLVGLKEGTEKTIAFYS